MMTFEPKTERRAAVIAVLLGVLALSFATGLRAQEPEQPAEPPAQPSPFDDKQELGFTVHAEVLDVKKLERAAISVLKKSRKFTTKQAQAEVRVYADDGKSYQVLRSRCMQIVMGDLLQTKIKSVFVRNMEIANSNVVEAGNPNVVSEVGR